LQISAADELVATELMFNGVYNSLDAHQLVALVSCLVPSDKSEVTYNDSELSKLLFQVHLFWLPFLDQVDHGVSLIAVQAEVKLVRALAGPLEQLQNTALRIGQLQVRIACRTLTSMPAVYSLQACLKEGCLR
jgi:superfamily II RNA helicase